MSAVSEPRTSETCAYPQDRDGEHDHGACEDAPSVAGEADRPTLATMSIGDLLAEHASLIQRIDEYENRHRGHREMAARMRRAVIEEEIERRTQIDTPENIAEAHERGYVAVT